MKALSMFAGALCVMLALVALLFLPVMGLLGAPIGLEDALAQTGAPTSAPEVPVMAPVSAPAADPVKASLIEKVLAAFAGVLPVVLSFASPYVTQGVTFLWSRLSPGVSAVLSTVVGSLLCAAAAAIFPGLIPPDVASVLGAGGGAAGHLLTQKRPIPTA